MSASLQYLWEMIHAQQIVILLALFGGVNIPDNANFIFSSLMSIAAFELIPTDDIYIHFGSDPDGGEPVSKVFEDIGFEHHLLMNNFGTLGFFLALYPFIYLTYYIVVQFQGVRCCRRTAKRMASTIFWSSLLRLIIESYIICFICCLCNLRKLDFSFDDNWTSINAVLTCVIFPIVILFPIWSVRKMYKNFLNLKQKEIN